MSQSAPDVSIAIVSWNARWYLRRCLASLYQPHDPDVVRAWSRAGQPASGGASEGLAEDVSWEVVVVDQESLDGSAEMVEAEFPQARLIRQRPNLGFGGGNNVAFRHARGRYVLLLNSDTVTRPGWITELVQYADAHPRAALIGPKLLNPDGSLQFSCRRFPSLGMGLFRHTPLEWLLPKNSYTRDYLMQGWDHRDDRTVDWLSGACILARREFIDEVGGFDERYFMYFEDVDWGFRAHKAGWDVRYTPAPPVIHEIGRSSDRRPKRMIVMHHESAYRYFTEHTHWGRDPVRRAVLAGGLAGRAALTLARNEGIKWIARLNGVTSRLHAKK